METAQQIFSIYVCAHEIVRDVIGSIFFGDELVQIILKKSNLRAYGDKQNFYFLFFQFF